MSLERVLFAADPHPTAFRDGPFDLIQQRSFLLIQRCNVQPECSGCFDSVKKI